MSNERIIHCLCKIDFAEGLKKLIDINSPRVSKTNYVEETLTKEIGLSAKQLWQYLSLLNLSPEVQEKVKEGEVGVRIGSQLSTLPGEKQEELIGVITEESLPSTVTEEVIRKVKEKPETDVEEIQVVYKVI